MSGPVQALAPGFLSLLGLKNNGALPPFMVDALAPSIELLPFYLQGIRETIPFTAAIGVNPVADYGFPELQVPANQIWYVHGLSVQFAVAAGATYTGMAAQFTRNIVPIQYGPPVSAGAAAVNTARASLVNFWAQSGDFLGVGTVASTVGATNAVATATISRFLI